MSGPRFWTMVVILAAAVAGFYTLRHGERVPPHQPLASFPMQVGSWQGFDIELSSRIAAATGADEILSRAYQTKDSELSLYIGYYRSQRTGDTIHSPKNCLPGGGWQPIVSTYTQLHTADGQTVPVNLYIIERGLDRSVVIYWYQSHGRIIANEYWAKFFMVEDAIRLNRTDAALVRVSTPVAGNEVLARERAVAFSEAILPQLNQIIPK